MISQRARQLAGNPSAIVRGHLACLENPYSLENPKGFVNFGIAENHMMNDLLLPALSKSVLPNEEHIQYCDLRGLESTRNLMTNFFKEYLGIPHMDPEKLIINSGVSSLCESLSFSLFDEGDQILIPAPYYTGFEHDFTKRFKCEFIPVQLDPQKNFRHEITPFKEAFKAYRNIKGILLTHPHNPTGEILDETFQDEIIAFSKEYDLHLICDEIYALSQHNKVKHQSLYQRARKAGANAHFLYGMAKDFCLAGFKLGFFYSDFEEVSQAVSASSYFYPVASITQLHLENLISDKNFLNSYLRSNSERLTSARNHLLTELSEFSFIFDEAAMFMLLDLNYKCQDLEDEPKLFNMLMQKYGVNITPGLEQGLNTPGYFRVCYARDKSQRDEFILRMKKAKEQGDL
ncbi:MAG: hypothetical protein CME65_13500 [Halobacteriovoraceae bacterium]|nr:hypothetical protein [Halobacteriovoraceae bacterium]